MSSSSASGGSSSFERAETAEGASNTGGEIANDDEISKARQKAINKAWKREKELVRQGKGTRDWTVSQQQELLSEGKITGFEGQHMMDASSYPEFAGDPNNIQWLTYAEHHFGAHQGKWTNSTKGRVDYTTGEFIPFKDGEVPSVPVIELTDKYDPAQSDFVSQLGRDFGYGRKEDYQAARERHKGEQGSYRFGKD